MFFNALATIIKNDLKTTIRKHVNVLKVPEETMRTVIKHDVDPDINPLITLYGAF